MQEDEYTKLTVNSPLAAARAFGSLGEKFNSVYMSGEGAVMDKEGGMLFARVKGKAERELLNLQEESSSSKVYNVRPGGINPEGKYLAERTPDWAVRSIHMLGNVFERFYKNMVISTESLAKATVGLAVGHGEPVPAGRGVEEGGRLLRNTALRDLAERAG
ncbi:hypothetical protein CLAFUW4_12330 [Fulvia fulva]|uniref:Uncharacterized protein n=1 Tax=Passalora fulva TaxID=5499 RepID=A0A9Q8PEJ6_PASFU|nr:uncharacterized protein CLAFUR5_11360 [Fulvia fulva]KAK4617640.1 hypothetical protein CLAFUR4_12335 [Fulvia fulva]KAK4618377.1 hypothetical protein CLAFUR0_12346 [Fulvia fulva]UJO20972.1 hypothetical protein CLAFUR5_11360 [Fulvia fulva]WPV17791.1 hypothetical protein CLAFUW4_12330 [Fulvia fulva]WPV33205.1 hypothetical protein CLAFUW7_12337 [Fulvia fulva]